MSDAENVWKCIQVYRTNAARELERSYGRQSAILAKLESYPRKGEYHGHASGTAGSPENASVSETLNAAISFLRLHKPAPAVASGLNQKKVNTVLKQASQDKTATLQDIIAKNHNFDTISSLLAEKDSQWHKNKTVWTDFSIKYELKKKKKPVKPA